MTTPKPRLDMYQDALVGCRFCPMCKPKGEVGRVTSRELHTTRGRAMQLWRILNGHTEWSERVVEVLFEAGLDSASGAWCVSKIPVAEYIIEARAAALAAGFTPRGIVAVREHVEAVALPTRLAKVVVYADDAHPSRSWLRRYPEATLVSRGGIGLAYAAGLWQLARSRAEALVTALRGSGVTTLIADGPAAVWSLGRVLKRFELSLPVTAAYSTGYVATNRELMTSEALPGYFIHSGYHRMAGVDMRAPLRVMEAAGGCPVLAPGPLESTDDVGVEGGLHRMYPELAALVAERTLRHVDDQATVVSDCPETVSWINAVRPRGIQAVSLIDLV